MNEISNTITLKYDVTTKKLKDGKCRYRFFGQAHSIDQHSVKHENSLTCPIESVETERLVETDVIRITNMMITEMFKGEKK